MIEDTMTLLSLLGRIMRYFLLRPETLFLLCISLALWSYFFHTDEVKTIVKSSRDAVKMVKGKVAEIMQNDRLGGLDVLEAEFSKTWEFKSHNVAVYSIQGRRDHMEDRFEVLTDLANKTHPSIFGIFDGHGGETAAEYVKSRLPEALKQHLQDYEKDKENSVLSYQTILEQQILSIDREMLEKLTVSYDEAGTTCLIALLSDKDLTVANVGDSRGVLCDKDGNAIPLSHDHKPYQLKERKRIKRAGATAAPLPDTDGGHQPERSVHRVPEGCSQAGHHPPAGSKPELQSSRVTNQLFSLCPGGEFDSSPHISPVTMGTTAPVRETVLTSLELGSPSCEELTTGPTTSKCVWLLNTKGSRRMWAQAHRLSPLPWPLGSWDHHGSCRFQQCRQNILSRKRRLSPFFLNEGGTQEATGRHPP
ncbi:protein phosphatase 1L isoform X1 [Lagenorhynchus albirostris]|nr:protein phosphatase 1L isoform X1 [Lagenorhynchus albirostris]